MFCCGADLKWDRWRMLACQHQAFKMLVVFVFIFPLRDKTKIWCFLIPALKTSKTNSERRVTPTNFMQPSRTECRESFRSLLFQNVNNSKHDSDQWSSHTFPYDWNSEHYVNPRLSWMTHSSHFGLNPVFFRPLSGNDDSRCTLSLSQTYDSHSSSLIPAFTLVANYGFIQSGHMILSQKPPAH